MTLACAYHGATGSNPLAEYIRPDSDVETSNWFSTPLFEKIDNNSASDYIFSSNSTQVWPSYNTYDFECGLSNPTKVPQVAKLQGMYLRVNLQLQERDSPGTPGNADFTYRLKQGSTIIASNTFSTETLDSASTRTYTLSEGEVDSITDHQDLRVFITVNIGHSSGNPNLQARVNWAEVEYYAR